MIQSMTGYGLGQAQDSDWLCGVEIRSVNSRYCEVRVHGLRDRVALDHAVQALIKKTFVRGKFDVVCHQEAKNPQQDAWLDEKTFIKNAQQLQNLARKAKLAEPPTVATVLQTMTSGQKQGDDQPLQTLYLQAVKKACQALTQSRLEEGQALMDDVLQRADALRALCKKIEKRTKTFLKQKKKDLHQRIEAWTQGEVALDADRLEMELVMWMEKSDVTEELVRLQTHVESIARKSKKNANKGIGRELDFILQEINREVNTIGSKMQDATAAQGVIAMKQEVEKIREQAQNIQ
jgi:uncharacterized protein (TIGR00255 family)